MIVGPIQAQMDDFCDLHGTPDTPVSRIVTVNARTNRGQILYGVTFVFHTYFMTTWTIAILRQQMDWVGES